MAVENPDEFIGPSTFSELPGVGEDFYFGQIVNAKGSIDDRPVEFGGYIVFYGHIDASNTLMIAQLKHVVLYETLPTSAEKTEFISLTLTGPLNPAFLPLELDHNWYAIDMRLEYFGMEDQHKLYRGDEPGVPEVMADLTLTPLDIADRDKLELALTLETENVASDKGWGIVPQVTIDTPAAITFIRIEPKPIETRPAEPGDRGSPVPPDCWQRQIAPLDWVKNDANEVYELNVVFLLFSNVYDLNNQEQKEFIQDLCRKQLSYVCQVWWHLCALKVVVWPNQSDDPVKDIHICPGDKAKALTLVCDNTNMEYINQLGLEKTKGEHCVEICLVDAIASHPIGVEDTSDTTWAGGTYPPTGANMAYCLLNITGMQKYDYLLAHELGHVLGLNDSHKPKPHLPGSAGSIMDIGFVDQPDKPLPKNTVENCKIFKNARDIYIDVITHKKNDPAFFYTVDPW